MRKHTELVDEEDGDIHITEIRTPFCTKRRRREIAALLSLLVIIGVICSLVVVFLQFELVRRSGSDENDGTITARPQSFIAIGDWGILKPPQFKVSKTMGAMALQTDLRFILSTGDQFYPNGVQSVNDPMFETYWQAVYNTTVPNVPWYVVLGNHDHFGNFNAQIQYTHMNNLWNMPSRYYSKRETLGGASLLMLFIDTFVYDEECTYANKGEFGREQLRWLENMLVVETTLGGEMTDYVFVVGHHPVLIDPNSDHGNTSTMSGVLKPVFDRYKISAYFASHEHNLQFNTSNGISYWVSGSGGKLRQQSKDPYFQFVACENGFLLVTSEDNGNALLGTFVHARSSAENEPAKYRFLFQHRMFSRNKK